MAEPIIDPGGGGGGDQPDKRRDGQSHTSGDPLKDQVIFPIIATHGAYTYETARMHMKLGLYYHCP